MDHILLGCSYSREVWDSWLRRLHLQDTVTVREETAIRWWLHSRNLVPKAIRRGFDSLFFLIGWLLWKEQNARTFNREASSAVQLCIVIQEEVNVWCLAGYKHLRMLWGAALTRCRLGAARLLLIVVKFYV
jgi:hypothetical protein